MTGAFTIVSPEKCTHYAGFMQHLNRAEADAIFWSLFVFMIILLVIASTMYTKASATLSTPESEPTEAVRHIRVRRKCLYISLACFILAFVSVVVEAFAAFSIQFCDGEDLMMLYWGFWTLVQVGSLIAIFGIMLNQWYCMGDIEHPPWNVALGTPVLVIAALGHVWQSSIKAAWRKRMGKADKAKIWSLDEVNSPKVPTTPPHPGARHIGFSLSNEALYAFSPQAPGIPTMVNPPEAELEKGP